ncbi:MAG TPA: YciI family protein [Chryseolinea sp.]|nr:YciI family protein [Chryseolinea sp.]HPH46117.1 YciI family protein [Chryseolinea sp.]HPM28776.1 YciI family protein [Chryseolinea sp.]
MRIFTFLFFIFSFSLSAQEKQYTFVFLNKKENPVLPKEQVDKIMEGHMANINRLAKEGKLILAGPFEGGGGIFILNTTSVDEAKEWLSTDPGVQANRWNVELLPFKSRIGGVCGAKEPYEMTMYSFVRFIATVSKFTASTYPQILHKHDEYIKELKLTGNVIAEGTFGEHDGGILVMKGDITTELFENDPGVKEALLELSIKSLWVAKGSFCEK